MDSKDRAVDGTDGADLPSSQLLEEEASALPPIALGAVAADEAREEVSITFLYHYLVTDKSVTSICVYLCEINTHVVCISLKNATV